MGLCYLLTIYCFVRGGEAKEKGSARSWFSLSVLACLAGAATKEVIVTAPLMVFLYDRTFISGSFRGAARRHWPLYAALAATWLPLGYFMRGLDHRAVGFGQGVAWWEYGLTESHAVVSHLRLSLWPHPLIFDYGAYAATPLSGLWPYVLILTALVAVTVAALRRSPAAGFAACWFFLILAPTSSIIPIVAQPMAENRLYLPLAGVVGFAVLGKAFRLVGRRSLAVLAMVAAALGLASVQRNLEYSSEQAIWSDTVAKNPDNARAHNDLGYALMAIPGRLDDAIAQYDEALRLQPGFAHAYSNRAVAHLKKGDFTRALADCNEALRLNPGFADATCNRADTYAGKGDYDHAIADYNEAIRLNPDFANAYNNLAWLLAACSEDRIRDGRRAEDYARKGCDLTEWKKPDFIDTLAVASAEAGDFGEAIRWENRYLEFDLPKEVAESARQRLSLFAAKKAYHEGRKPN